MAKKDHKQEEVILDVEQSISKAEKYLKDNQKSLGIIVGAVVALVVGYWAYNYMYLAPREEGAQKELYSSQMLLESDSLRLALNGDGTSLGFLAIADEYSGTKAANLSHYYAGVCYLNLGDFTLAIEQLDQFSTDDEVLNVLSKTAIGDAFLEINQPKEALEYYGRAAGAGSNAFVVPVVLKKAGMVAEMQGELDLALKYFNRIKEEFSTAREAQDIDKYIARVEAKKLGA